MNLSKLKQTLLGATLVLSSLVMQLNAQSSSPKRITVDPSSKTNSGTSFSTIKMAVDSARTGDTVIVSDGTYKEKVLFNSNYSNKKLVLGSFYLIDNDENHIKNTIINIQFCKIIMKSEKIFK
jgi:pectin methylesterase-like acyl-CoA thioesterase